MAAKKSQPEVIKKGREVMCDEVMVTRLLDAMSSGKITKAMICRELQISRPTFYRWLETQEDFKEAYERGKELAEAWWDEVGIQGMLSKKIDATLYMGFRNNYSGWQRGAGLAQDNNVTSIQIENLNILNQVKQLTTEELEEQINLKLALLKDKEKA